MIYSANNLPKFAANTTGYTLPVPESRIACPMPYEGHVLAPWELQVAGPEHWHCLIEANMNPENVYFWPKGWPKSRPRHDEYANDEVMDMCVPQRIVPYGKDPRADALYDTYRHVPDLNVYEIVKTAPVIVLGQVTEDIVFTTSESMEDKGAKVKTGSYILKSPLRERYYFNTPEKFQKLYNGKVIPGEIPTALIEEVQASWKKFGFTTS